jgi:hypothetical protein
MYYCHRPAPSVDCEYAALALLDDATEQCWSGEYQTWSAFLPEGAQDIYPGDALHVHIPTQGADFRATVLRVDISLCDLETDNAKYTIYFADEGSVPARFCVWRQHERDSERHGGERSTGNRADVLAATVVCGNCAGNFDERDD